VTGELGAGALNLVGGVQQRAVVDAHRIRALIFDDGAVHERAEVPERLVVQLAAGDAPGTASSRVWHASGSFGFTG
jgi:hypothetical protein